jgi:hypothetical protein
MPLTRFQKDICHLIATNRKEQNESYVAGGSALNEIIGAPRLSHDIDLFHDIQKSLLKTWEALSSLTLIINNMLLIFLYSIFINVTFVKSDSVNISVE